MQRCNYLHRNELDVVYGIIIYNTYIINRFAFTCILNIISVENKIRCNCDKVHIRHRSRLNRKKEASELFINAVHVFYSKIAFFVTSFKYLPNMQYS